MNRLLALRKFLGLTQRQMAEVLCIRQNAYSMIETGKTSLSARNRSLLAEKLHVNPHWLTDGKGEMFSIRDTNAAAGAAQLRSRLSFFPPSAGRPQSDSRPNPGVPFYSGVLPDPSADTGKQPAEPFAQIPPDYTVDFRPFNDCAFYYSVKGNSMSPLYNPGEIIACKSIDTEGYLPLGETYLCMIRQQEGCCETLRVLYSRTPESFLLKPLNPSFEPTVVAREHLLALYVVKGKIVINM